MPITALPPAPAPTDSRANFITKAFATVAALMGFTTEANALEVNVNAKEAAANISAASAAASAAAAQALAGAVGFNAATNYAQYAAAISTVNLLTYRRKTAGISATDPSADSTNWVNTGLPPVVVVRTAVDVTMIAGTVYVATVNGLNFTLPATPGGQDLCYYRLGVGVSRLVLKGNGNKVEGQTVGTDIDIFQLGRLGRLNYNATDGWLHI